MIWLNIQSIIWIWCYSTHFLQYFSPLCIILWYIKKITTMMTSQPNVYLWRSFGGCGSPHKVQLWLKIIYIIFCVFNFKSSVNCVFGRTFVFLAVHNSSIGDLVPWLVRPTKLTIRAFTTLQSDPRDLWPLRHLIRQIFGRF